MIDPGACPKVIIDGNTSSRVQVTVMYMNINDIASLLSISKRTLERVIEHDERFPKPCFTVGKKAKWKESRIIDFLDTNVGIHLKTS